MDGPAFCRQPVWKLQSRGPKTARVACHCPRLGLATQREAVFCRQDCCLYARAPYSQVAKLGPDCSPGTLLLCAREDAQLSYRHAKLPTGTTHSEQGR